MPVSLSLSHIPLHSLSLSLSRLRHILSTLSRSRFSTLSQSRLVTLTQTPSHPHASLILTAISLTLSTISQSPLSSTVSICQSVLSCMIFLLCDFFMWVCGFCSKVMIDLIVSCVTLFGFQENARKIYLEFCTEIGVCLFRISSNGLELFLVQS